MNNFGKKYKVVNSCSSEEINVGRVIVQFGILSILCILAFLVAKYIVRSDIEGEKVPIDTSERL